MSLYLPDRPDVFLGDPVDESGVLKFASEHRCGSDPEQWFWVRSTPYPIFNPWPMIFQLCHEHGPGSDGMPMWADREPFTKFENIKLMEWDPDLIPAIIGDSRTFSLLGCRLGIALGIAYSTMLMYIKRTLAFLTRSMRSLTAPLKALQPHIWRTQCLSHFRGSG